MADAREVSAAVAAVLDLVPAGARIVGPEDCYFGVGELQHTWALDREP
jgi:hypothetical protein